MKALIKTCNGCKVRKLIREFKKDSQYCKICYSELHRPVKRSVPKRPKIVKPPITDKWLIQRRIRAEAMKIKARQRDRFSKYGITFSQYHDMLKAQRGCCAVCNKDFSDARQINIDHDHSTNEVRGLLCSRCNTLLGQCGDTLEGIRLFADQCEAYLS